MSRPRLSVVVVTLDEEERIRACLESVAWADELIVVDAESRDKTAAIARELTDHVFVRPWPGFAAQKNFGIEQARGEWILSLDADEVVSAGAARGDRGGAGRRRRGARRLLGAAAQRLLGPLGPPRRPLSRLAAAAVSPRARSLRGARGARVRGGRRLGRPAARPSRAPQLSRRRRLPRAHGPLHDAGRRRLAGRRAAGRDRSRTWSSGRSGASSGCTCGGAASWTGGGDSFWPCSMATMCSCVRPRSGRERGADAGTGARAVGDASEREPAPGELSRRAGELGATAR